MDLKEKLFGSTRKAKTVCKVVNKVGLHARPACLLVQKAAEFQSEIQIAKENSTEIADAKSVMSTLTLAATCGTTLVITAQGSDAETAVNALKEIVESGFGED